MWDDVAEDHWLDAYMEERLSGGPDFPIPEDDYLEDYDGSFDYGADDGGW